MDARLKLIRGALAFSLVLLTACATPRELPPSAVTRAASPARGAQVAPPVAPAQMPVADGSTAERAGERRLPVGARDLDDGSLMLLFPLRLPEPGLERMGPGEVRPIIAGFASLGARLRLPVRLLESPGAARSGGGSGASQLRDEYLSLFGPGLLPVPQSLESSRLFLALRMSARFMGEGFRQAAVELFNSPAFVLGLCASVVLYFSAWLAPEPLFTKAFAAALTVRLSMIVGLIELKRVAQACLRLYEDAEAARSPQELEEASRRFGMTIGGTGLRVLVLVTTMGVGRLAPEVPEGGVRALMQAFQTAEGPMLEGSVLTAQIVADGTLVVTGVSAGMAVAAVGAGAPSGGGPQLSTRYGPPHTRSNPPHNEAIEEDLAAREAAGHKDLLKNKAQVNAAGKRVFERPLDPKPRFRRPDASSTRPDGVRHNINYVSNPRDMQRELKAFESMTKADESAIHELYTLDGTLVRRYVPAGMRFP